MLIWLSTAVTKHKMTENVILFKKRTRRGIITYKHFFSFYEVSFS